MSVKYVELVDYLAIAVEVTGLSVETMTRVAKLDLADSALHAPAAGFGDTNCRRWDPTPDVDQAERAVLAIAAGEWDESRTADWLRAHLTKLSV